MTVGTVDIFGATERPKRLNGALKRKKAEVILKELIVKTKKDELSWKEESCFSDTYVTIWKSVEIKLSASEPVRDIDTHFSLDAGYFDWWPLFPIWGELSMRKLSALEESPLASSPQYSVSKEGPYWLLKELYNVVEEKVENLKWMRSNSLELAEKILGISIENLPTNEIQKRIIRGLLKRVERMEWKIDYERSRSSIYTPYAGSFEGFSIKIEKSVPDWFFLIIEMPGSKKSVMIDGRKKKGYRELIPDQETRFYGALENFYNQVDRKYWRLARARRRAEIRKKSSRFLGLLRDC